jgi:hypothetical protein
MRRGYIRRFSSTPKEDTAMRPSRRRFLGATLVGSAVLAGCSTTPAMPSFAGDALMSSLTSGAGGLSTAQAAGGLGSVMSLAQSRLGGDFSQLARYLPSADKYLQVAKDAGVLKSPITDVAGLNNAFKQLNIDPMQARGLLDATSSYLTKQGGDAGKSLLTRALAI